MSVKKPFLRLRIVWLILLSSLTLGLMAVSLYYRRMLLSMVWVLFCLRYKMEKRGFCHMVVERHLMLNLGIVLLSWKL